MATTRRRHAYRELWRAAAPVARVTGQAVVKEVDSENGRWQVKIGEGPDFDLQTVAAQAFLTPLRYTVHYLPGKTVIPLSAEPVVAGGAAAPDWPPPQGSAAADAALAERLDELVFSTVYGSLALIIIT